MNKNNCPVHGEEKLNQEQAGTRIPEPLADCTCDVGTTGPALEGKGNTPTGPALEGKGNTPVGPGLGGRQHFCWSGKVRGCGIATERRIGFSDLALVEK